MARAQAVLWFDLTTSPVKWVSCPRALRGSFVRKFAQILSRPVPCWHHGPFSSPTGTPGPPFLLLLPLQTSHVFPLRTQIHNSATGLISAIAFEMWKASNNGLTETLTTLVGFHDTSWFTAWAVAVVKREGGVVDGIWPSSRITMLCNGRDPPLWINGLAD